jgi:hypothetical protein
LFDNNAVSLGENKFSVLIEMCGRTCMTLAPEELKCACKFEKGEGSGDDGGGEAVPVFRSEYNLGLIMSELKAS